MQKRDGKPSPRIYFTNDEAHAIAMGLNRVIEEGKKVMSDSTYPWTDEAKRIHRDILKNAATAGAKLLKFTGIKTAIPDYEEGDENDFFKK